MIKKYRLSILFYTLLVVLPSEIYAIPVNGTTRINNGTGEVTVQGELKKWHKVTLMIDGPASSEDDANNPFLNYRLNVTFTNGSKTYVVPGYFAADGNAGETSATTGNVWKVHFAPDEVGTWNYSISMRSGSNIAVSDDPNAGSAVSPVNGKTGSFQVSETDKGGVDLRGKGRLMYIGEHYLRFAQTGEYFLKGGVDSPENLLAYEDFDNTPNTGSRRKSFTPHKQDWQPGDPTWQGDKGKGLIGAINYLASQGLNAYSFLTMNINGDDKNVFPYMTISDYTRFDCSKLDQWEKVFEHADTKGMYQHFKLQEKENDRLLDGGDMGVQRKLYFRELIARFSHHLAMNWNLGEENKQSDQQRKDAAKYLYDHDPYRHHVVIHIIEGDQDSALTLSLGNKSLFTGLSLQAQPAVGYSKTKEWVQKSAQAGRKWVVANDEQPPGERGVAADADYTGNRGIIADNQDDIRKNSLWGNIMAMGGGVEYYFGYNTGETDLTLQDFRSRAKMWRFTRHALKFFKTYVPLHEVSILANVSRGVILGKQGELYVIYLKSGGSANITIDHEATYTIKWYNPRSGELKDGSVTSFSGTGSKSIGNPPAEADDDWAVLVKKINATTPANQAPSVSAGNDRTITLPTNSVTLEGSATDADGSIASYAWTQRSGPNTATLSGANTATLTASSLVAGTYVFRLTATDNAGATGFDEVSVVVNSAPANQLPVANAGPDKSITLPASSVTLEGSGTDADGTISSYAWTQSSGPNTTTFSSTTSATPTVSNMVAGTYVFSLTVKDNQQAGSAADQVMVTVNSTPEAGGTRINTGGSAFTASGSRKFTADTYFSGGTVYNAGNVAIDNTTDDVLYQTERYGAFSYNVPVSSGNYQVILHFAETHLGVKATGTRKFNVDIEGHRKLTEYDITAVTGGPLKAIQESFVVSVSDGTLNIVFTKGSANNPKVSAIEIVPGSEPAPNTAPVLSAIGNKSLTVGSTLTFKAQATDADGNQSLSYSLVNAPSGAGIDAATGAFSWTTSAAGSFTFTVKVTDSGSPALSDDETITVTVNPATSTSGQSLVSFTLINADTEQPIRDLVSNDVLNLATLPSRNLSIRANTDPDRVGSVRFVLSGKQSRTQTESGFPYALFGDNSGNYNAWTPALGDYTLNGTPYTEGGAKGTAGTALTIDFTVVNHSSARLSLEEQDIEGQDFQIISYPNPFNETFKLQVKGKRTDKLPVVLYNFSGQVVLQVEDIGSEKTYTLGKDIAPGTYFLQVGAGKNVKYFKIIKAE